MYVEVHRLHFSKQMCGSYQLLHISCLKGTQLLQTNYLVTTSVIHIVAWIIKLSVKVAQFTVFSMVFFARPFTSYEIHM